jgi:hypothetical protein
MLPTSLTPPNAFGLLQSLNLAIANIKNLRPSRLRISPDVFDGVLAQHVLLERLQHPRLRSGRRHEVDQPAALAGAPFLGLEAQLAAFQPLLHLRRHEGPGREGQRHAVLVEEAELFRRQRRQQGPFQIRQKQVAVAWAPLHQPDRAGEDVGVALEVFRRQLGRAGALGLRRYPFVRRGRRLIGNSVCAGKICALFEFSVFGAVRPRDGIPT